MNDDIYNKFWEVIGKPRPNGFFETYEELLGANVTATLEAFKAGDHARADAIREAFDAIGGRAAHAKYSANQLDSLLVHQQNPAPITESLVKRGFATRISQGLNGLVTRAKGIMPQRPVSLGEPKPLPLVDLASGAPLEPALDGKTHIRLAAEQIPTPEPIKPTNLAETEKVTSKTVRAASADTLAAAKAAEAERQLARAERSEEMRAASAAEREAAKAAYDAELAGRPVRQEAVHAATAENIVAAEAAQAEAAASKAARVASAKATARAAFQAPKGSFGRSLTNNTANLAQRATMPLINRFSTQDPYKILGITPHTSQTAAMAAFEAKLSALGEKRMTSPRAQFEWQRLHDAYEAVYDNLFERPKFTPPAIPVPERTSKIGAAMGRVRENVSNLSARITSIGKRNTAELATPAASDATSFSAALEPLHDPNRLILNAEEMAKLKPPTVSALTGNLTLAEKQAAASASLAAQRAKALAAQQAAAGETSAQTGRSLILHPTANTPAAVLAETPNLPILHPTAIAPHGDIGAATSSEIKLISGPVYEPAAHGGSRYVSYLDAAVEHSPLRGKLLLAAGVVAAAAVGYFGNRKQEKYPMPPMQRPRAASWAEATQQPAISGELQR